MEGEYVLFCWIGRDKRSMFPSSCKDFGILNSGSPFWRNHQEFPILDANLEKPSNFWTNGPIFKIQSSKMVRISPEFARKPHSGDRMAHLAITFVRKLWQIFTPAILRWGPLEAFSYWQQIPQKCRNKIFPNKGQGPSNGVWTAVYKNVHIGQWQTHSGGGPQAPGTDNE